MTQSTSFVQEGIDRFQSAVDSIDRDVRKLQKNLRGQRKDLEKRLERGRKSVERRTRKQIDRALADVRSQPVYKRAESLRKDVAKRVERGVENVLETVGIATQGEIRRIDRKLGQLHKKLRDLEKTSASLA